MPQHARFTLTLNSYADDIARARFNKAVDELTPEEGHYVDLAKLDDSALRVAANAGDESASEILRARRQLADALDETLDAADVRTTRTLARNEFTDRVLNRARTPAWTRAEGGLWTRDARPDRADVDADARRAEDVESAAGRGQDRFDTEGRRNPGNPLQARDDVGRFTPDDTGRILVDPFDTEDRRTTPDNDDRTTPATGTRTTPPTGTRTTPPTGTPPPERTLPPVRRRPPPVGILPPPPPPERTPPPDELIIDPVDPGRTTPPTPPERIPPTLPPVRRRPPPVGILPPPPPRIEPPDVVMRDPGTPPPGRRTPPPQPEDVPPVVPGRRTPPDEDDGGKPRRATVRPKSHRGVPPTDEAPHPKIVVRQDVVSRELDLETGEETIVVHEGSDLVVTERGPRPYRNRRIPSGNRTITTDDRGAIHEQRKRTRRKLHPFLTRGELRSVNRRRQRSTTDRARRRRPGRTRRR